MPQFQSTPSVWRETSSDDGRAKTSENFNPLPPCGGRRQSRRQRRRERNFNPLPPCGGRLAFAAIRMAIKKFQSTPSVWRETTIDGREWHGKSISIHSLRVEGDAKLEVLSKYSTISIHSLRVEGDGLG